MMRANPAPNMNGLQGKHICITGRLDRGKRDEVFGMIIARGGIRDNYVYPYTDFLVVGDISRHNGSTRKLRRAIEIGTAIISEDELFSMFC